MALKTEGIRRLCAPATYNAAGNKSMTRSPDHWGTVERLYHAALARPAGERAAFLAEACAGDEALRRDIESLLAQPASADNVLARGAIAAAAGLISHVSASGITGQRIGVYQ